MELYVKMVGAKKLLVFARDLVGFFRSARKEILGNLALNASAKANEALMPFL